MKPTWVVCIKQVPEEPVFKKTRDSFQIDRERTEGILNPFDRFALEFATGLKEEVGGRMVAITMGPPQAEEALREALAFGTDKAILLSDPAFAGADTLATAHTLAAAIRKVGDFSLILCGARTLDSDSSQVGPQLAELLDLPMAAYVDALDYRRGVLRVERRLDGYRERLQLPLPALITVAGTKENKPPLSLRSLEDAFSGKAVAHWRMEDLGVDPSRIGWEGSATQARDFSFSKKVRSGEIVEGRPAELADRIVSALMSRNILGK